MPDAKLDAQFFEQSQKPMHGAGSFQAHQHRLRQSGIKLPHLLAFMRQLFLDQFSRLIIQHGNRLLSCV